MQLFWGFILAASVISIIDGISITGMGPGVRPFVVNAACGRSCRERKRARLAKEDRRIMMEEIQRREKLAKCAYVRNMFGIKVNQCAATPAIMYADTTKMNLWFFYKNECIPKEHTLMEYIYAVLFFLFAFGLIILFLSYQLI